MEREFPAPKATCALEDCVSEDCDPADSASADSAPEDRALEDGVSEGCDPEAVDGSAAPSHPKVMAIPLKMEYFDLVRLLCRFGLLLAFGCTGPTAAPPPGSIVPPGEPSLDAGIALQDGAPADTSLPSVDAGAPGPAPVFVDVTSDVGIAFVHHDPALPFPCNGSREERCSEGIQTGGAAVADYDNDGDPDIFFTSLSGQDALYRNDGGRFVDVTEDLGLGGVRQTNGATFVDVDADADLDLLVLGYGEAQHYLYLQGADGRFSEHALSRGLGIDRGRMLQGIGVAAGDVNGDGYIDLHLTEWIEQFGLDRGTPGTGASLLFLNRGSEAPGHFQEATPEPLLLDQLSPTHSGSFGLSTTFTDFDGDGHLDLAIAGDFASSKLFWNRGDGSFYDGSAIAGVALDRYGMGTAIGDYDNDGDLDWFVTSIFGAAPALRGDGNRLYRYEGERRFDEVAEESGVVDAGWPWGAVFFDYDNDGDLDLGVVNGMFTDERSRLFVNDGSGRFEERGEELGLADYGAGRAMAILDFDGDGDLDVLAARNQDAPMLLRNDAPSRPSMRLRLRQPGPNPFALGARVILEDAEGRRQLRELRGGGSFEGHSELVLHFGVNSESRCGGRFLIRWPDGASQEVTARCGNMTVVRAPAGT